MWCVQEKLDAFEDSLAALYKEARGRPKRLQEGSICIAHPEMLYHRIRIRELRDAEVSMCLLRSPKCARVLASSFWPGFCATVIVG